MEIFADVKELARALVAHERAAGAASRRGVVLFAPDGAGRHAERFAAFAARLAAAAERLDGAPPAGLVPVRSSAATTTWLPAARVPPREFPAKRRELDAAQAARFRWRLVDAGAAAAFEADEVTFAFAAGACRRPPGARRALSWRDFAAEAELALPPGAALFSFRGAVYLGRAGARPAGLAVARPRFPGPEDRLEARAACAGCGLPVANLAFACAAGVHCLFCAESVARPLAAPRAARAYEAASPGAAAAARAFGIVGVEFGGAPLLADAAALLRAAAGGRPAGAVCAEVAPALFLDEKDDDDE